MESARSSGVHESEEEFDPPDTGEDFHAVGITEENETPSGSSHVDVELTQNIHGNGSSHEVRIDLGVGTERVNPDQAQNDEISVEVRADGVLDDVVPNEQNQQHVPYEHVVPPHVPFSVVPPHVRRVDEMSYTPKWVSIGPIHHNRKSLWLTKEKKRQFLGPSLDEARVRRKMRESENRVREHYSMTFQGISSADFVDMLVIDGCFIVELLCRNYKCSKEGVGVTDYPIYSTRWMLPEIGVDLLMIENQLPLFVLEKIFKATELKPNGTSFEEVALEFFKSFHIGKEAMVIEERRTGGHHKHLLDLFHSLYVPPESPDSDAPEERQRNKKPLMDRPSVRGKNWVPSATVLKSSGVRFHAKEGNSLEIQFRRAGLSGRLRIPSISIDESSIIILKNLLAYEQSSRRIEPLFTSLVLFFSSMASVPDDIKLLREASIILHQPGDDQMAIEVLKLLSKQLECDVRDCSMKQQVEDIRAYCGCNLVKFWNAIGRFLALNAARFILMCLFLVLTFLVNNFLYRL